MSPVFRVSAFSGILSAAALSCPLPASAQQGATGAAPLPATVPDTMPTIAAPVIGDAATVTEPAESTETEADAPNLQSELDAAKAELEALRQRLSDEQAQAMAEPDAPEPTADTPAEATDQAAPDSSDLPPPFQPATGAPRDSDLVASVVASAPGAPQDPAMQDRLRELLVQGVCAPDALAEVQNPINRQTLLALMTRLPRC